MHTHYYKSIFDIDFSKYENVEYLFFDIDNTLASPSDKVANEKVIEYIEKLKNNGYEIYLYSNNNQGRISKFASSLNIKYFPPAKKPFSRELVKFFKNRNEEKIKGLFIGDQIFTDVLGGKFAGIQVILVEPFSNKNDTWFVALKRFFEKPFRKIIIKNNKKQEVD